jgi:hypothetical protein
MPALNNVWRGRLTAGTRGAGRIILAVLVVTSSISGMGTLKRWVFPDAPLPVVAADIARVTINQTDLVKAFAIDCVTSYLTAASAQGTDLSRCFPDASRLAVPATPALILTAPTAYAQRTGPDREQLSTYGVLVGVTEQPYPTAIPERNYYQIPLGVYGGDAVRALDNLSRVDEPPAGADVELGYPITIPNNNPVAIMLAGFIGTYLTKSPGLDRFVTTDSRLKPVKHPYASATVTGVQAIANPPDAPAENFTLSVRVTVSARSAEYTPYDLSYPLTVRASAGNWFVAAIDPVPALAESTPEPPNSSAAGG